MDPTPPPHTDAGTPNLALAGELLEAIEREREALARALHDELGSNLTAINLDVTSVAHQLPEGTARGRLERALRVLKDAVELKRRLIQSLRPSMIDSLGLATTLRMELDAFAARTGVACTADFSDEHIALQGDLAIALYRVVEVCLGHLDAARDVSRVALSMQLDEHLVQLALDTDGKLPTAGSAAWLALVARIQRLKGELVRRDGEGESSLRATVPLTADQLA